MHGRVLPTEPSLRTWGNDLPGDCVLGEEEIDRDHRELLDLVLALEATLLAGSARTQVAEAACDLIEAIRAHFAHEEAMMAETAFPHRAVHRAEHVELVSTFVHWLFQFDMNTRAFTVDDAGFLRGWFFEHVRGMDRAFVQYLHRRRAARQDGDMMPDGLGGGALA